jgi:hypothetical protein
VTAVFVFFDAQRLSRRYNAWTTTFRKRYPRINPPPSDQARQVNETIMTWLFRILPFFFAFSALRALFQLRFFS